MHPQVEQESILGHFLLGRGYLEVYLVVLNRLLIETTKKVVNFLRKKVHPEKNPGYTYDTIALDKAPRRLIYR